MTSAHCSQYERSDGGSVLYMKKHRLVASKAGVPSDRGIKFYVTSEMRLSQDELLGRVRLDFLVCSFANGLVLGLALAIDGTDRFTCLRSGLCLGSTGWLF